jgi:hypothetical protein
MDPGRCGRHGRRLRTCGPTGRPDRRPEALRRLGPDGGQQQHRQRRRRPRRPAGCRTGAPDRLLVPTAERLLAEGKEVRTIDGRDHVLEFPLRADVALVTAHRSDEMGNLTYRKTGRSFGPIMATTCTTASVAAAREGTPGWASPSRPSGRWVATRSPGGSLPTSLPGPTTGPATSSWSCRWSPATERRSSSRG